MFCFAQLIIYSVQRIHSHHSLHSLSRTSDNILYNLIALADYQDGGVDGAEIEAGCE